MASFCAIRSSRVHPLGVGALGREQRRPTAPASAFPASARGRRDPRTVRPSGARAAGTRATTRTRAAAARAPAAWSAMSSSASARPSGVIPLLVEERVAQVGGLDAVVDHRLDEAEVRRAHRFGGRSTGSGRGAAARERPDRAARSRPRRRTRRRRGRRSRHDCARGTFRGTAESAGRVSDARCRTSRG